MKLAILALALAMQPGPTFVFDVVTIKPNNSGSDDTSVRRPPGGIVATNAPMAMIVSMAYAARPFQVPGLPGWMNTERFDMAAKINDSTPGAESQQAFEAALRAVLADRLKLVAHWETQERPVYALVRIRPDGPLGPALKRSAIDCEAMRAAGVAAAREGRPAPPAPPLSTPDRVACGIRNNGGRIMFGGNPIGLFTSIVGGELGRLVIDRTGLEGTWDFEFAYARERRLGITDSADTGLPSIFTAIEEQLGLRLESTNAAVQILVIDHVERPSPD